MAHCHVGSELKVALKWRGGEVVAVAAAVKKALKKAFEKQDRSNQLHNVSTRTRSVPSVRLCVPPLVYSLAGHLQWFQGFRDGFFIGNNSSIITYTCIQSMNLLTKMRARLTRFRRSYSHVIFTWGPVGFDSGKASHAAEIESF